MGSDSGGKAARRSRFSAAERRETILRAAAEVFAEVGYRAAKVSEIAARVGVTEPVIFQNFGSKAALFNAVVERAAAEARTWLDSTDPESHPSPGTAARVLEHVLNGTPQGHPHHGPDQEHDGPRHAVASAGALLADAATLTTEPDLGSSARDATRAVVGHLADLIRRAQSDGDARPDLDPEAAAWLLLSVLATRRLRAAAMPATLEPPVTALITTALLSPNSRAPTQRT